MSYSSVTVAIAACLFKNLPKSVNFCAAILTLKMEEDVQHFQHIVLRYFKKGKNATEMQKTDLHGCMRRCWDRSNVSKVVCEVSCTIDVLAK